MHSFLARFAAGIHGVLSRFDRIRFRDTQRLLASARGLTCFLAAQRLLLKDFNPFVTATTDRLRAALEHHAAEVGVPVTYVNNSSLSKEKLADSLAARAGRTDGLCAILSAVEPCRIFFVRKNPATGLLELQHQPGKCLHYSHYWHDQRLGPCHVRLQTWFPFNLFVCVNGREILARQLAREGIAFCQRDNCLDWVAEVPRAQQLLDEQVGWDWQAELTRLLSASHPDWWSWPVMDRDYYWSAEQTEWASDVMFRSAADLRRRMPFWLRHAVTGLGCADVMRFLGRPTTAENRVHGNFDGECGLDVVQRPEGARAS